MTRHTLAAAVRMARKKVGGLKADLRTPHVSQETIDKVYAALLDEEFYGRLPDDVTLEALLEVVALEGEHGEHGKHAGHAGHAGTGTGA